MPRKRKSNNIEPATAPVGAVADVYVRMSTIEQLKNGSEKEQTEQCLRILEERGLVLGKVWVENESGKNDERPKLNEMLGRAQHGTIRAIITLYKSRLSRLALHRNWIFWEMDKCGCEVVAIKDPRRLDKAGAILEAVDGYKDEDEVDTIAERMLGGKAQAAKAGRIPSGAGRNLYGYDYKSEYDHIKRVITAAYRVINTDEAHYVHEMFNMAEELMTPHQIATVLTKNGVPTKHRKHAWAATVVAGILTNRAYLGETRVSVAGIVIEVPGNCTPRIISDEQFNRVQEILGRREKQRQPRSDYEYLLRGIVRCGRCGRLYSGQLQPCRNRKGDKKVYIYHRYRCTSSNRSLCSCGSRTFTQHGLDRFVWDQFVILLRQPEIIMQYVTGLRDAAEDTARVQQLNYLKERKPVLEKDIETLSLRAKNTKSQSIYEQLERGVVEKEAELADTVERIATIEQDLEPLRVTDEVVEAVRRWLEEAGDDLDSFTYEEKVKALHLFRLVATVSPEGTHMTFTGRVPPTSAEIQCLRKVPFQSHSLSALNADVRFRFSVPLPPLHARM